MTIMQLSKKNISYKLMILALSFGSSITAIAADFATTKISAQQGNPSAQYILGVMYDRGKGVRQDYAKAFEWYQKAASQGYSNAQYNLGSMYYRGEGVRQDYAKAFEWHQKAAIQGDADAQYSLGLMYYRGEGVRQDKAISKEWAGKACDSGLQLGCNSYRIMNENNYTNR